LGRLGSKTRSTLKRKVKKFTSAAHDENAFHEYKTPAELMEFYGIARELSKRTYQERLLEKGLPEGDAFLQEMLRLASTNSVRAYSLHMNGEAIAYLYSPAKNGILYYDYLGYDPNYAEFSPGSVLQWLAFERLFAEKEFRVYDFDEGEGQHKRTFATRRLDCAKLMVFAPNLKSTVYVLLNSTFLMLTAFSLRVSDILHVRSFLRKLYR